MNSSQLFNGVCWLVHTAAIVGMIVIAVRPDLRERFRARCVGRADAKDLAYVRIVACAAMLAYALTEDLAGYARLDAELIRAPGYLLPFDAAFKWLHASSDRLVALHVLTVALLALSLVGLWTRVSLPLAALVYMLFAAMLRSLGKEFHEGYLGWYMLIVLSATPAGDAWSIDAWRGRARPRGDYGWAVYACFAAACVPYMQLGLSKLVFGGPFWFDGRSLRNAMVSDNLNLTEWNIDLALRFYEAPTILFTLAGAFALLTELAYPLVLVAPKLRRTIPVAISLLHVGVWAGQDALFLDAILVPWIFMVPSSWRRAQAKQPDTGVPFAHRATIAIVVACVALDFVTHTGRLKLEWPIAQWNMYCHKHPIETAVSYRRFVARLSDGSTKAVDPGDVLPFLRRPYRLDAALMRDRDRFLADCLRELRVTDPAITAIVYEERTWRYGEKSLDEHLMHDPPDMQYPLTVSRR